jgi:hypothetical protein
MDEFTDADLIRQLDGEPHGKVSAEARERLELLRRRSERVSRYLAELGPSQAQTQASADAIRPLMTRNAKAMPAVLKIAAAIVLLLGLTWAVPPARAWMLERARAIGGGLGFVSKAPAPAAAPDLPATSDVPESAAVRISFPVTADTFEIAGTPTAGLLIVQRNSETLGTAEAVAAPEAGFTVARGLRIEGGAYAQARYTVTLPARVVAVRVRGRVYSLPPMGDELRLDLARPIPD